MQYDTEASGANMFDLVANCFGKNVASLIFDALHKVWGGAFTYRKHGVIHHTLKDATLLELRTITATPDHLAAAFAYWEVTYPHRNMIIDPVFYLYSERETNIRMMERCRAAHIGYKHEREGYPDRLICFHPDDARVGTLSTQ